MLWKVTVLAFVHHGLGVSLQCYRTASIVFFRWLLLGVLPLCCLTFLVLELGPGFVSSGRRSTSRSGEEGEGSTSEKVARSQSGEVVRVQKLVTKDMGQIVVDEATVLVVRFSEGFS